MSVHILEDAHIDVLIDMAWQFEKARFEIPKFRERPLKWDAADGANRRLSDYQSSELGKMLLDENARSYSQRYREAFDPNVAAGYGYRPTNREYTAGQALLALQNYFHQACESPNWERSEARSFHDAVREMVINVGIPPSELDVWEWTDEKLGRVEGAVNHRALPNAAVSVNRTARVKAETERDGRMDVKVRGEREDVKVSGRFLGVATAAHVAVVEDDDGSYHGFREVDAFENFERGMEVEVHQHDGITHVHTDLGGEGSEQSEHVFESAGEAVLE